MNRLLKLGIFLFGIFCISFYPLNSFAHNGSTIREENSETGYELVIEDDADLLSRSEEDELRFIMSNITEYGNAIFKTIDYNEQTTSRFASEFYESYFGYESGTIFLIDMDCRYIYIFSNGEIYDTIDKDAANIITDNIYGYASDGEYFQCAKVAFHQMDSLLKGKTIAKPMKYISNFLIAICLALLLNFGGMACLTNVRKTRNNELLSVVNHRFETTNPTSLFVNQTRTYSPQSKGSSGGGGGGGHSGGGGGHSF